MSQPANHITVFIENEARSGIKHHSNEATFTVERTERVGAAYPFPYGFVPETLAPDGDAVDCFVLTNRHLSTGTTVEALPIAFVEQTEAGSTDGNVRAVLPGDPAPDLAATPRVGRTLGSNEAVASIAAGAVAHDARLRASET